MREIKFRAWDKKRSCPACDAEMEKKKAKMCKQEVIDYLYAVQHFIDQTIDEKKEMDESIEHTINLVEEFGDILLHGRIKL